MLNARRSGVTTNFRQLRRAGPPLRAGAAVCQWGRGRCREPSWLSACPGHSLPLADPECIFSGSCMVPRPSLQHSCAISCCFSASVRPQTARAERLEEKKLEIKKKKTWRIFSHHQLLLFPRRWVPLALCCSSPRGPGSKIGREEIHPSHSHITAPCEVPPKLSWAPG